MPAPSLVARASSFIPLLGASLGVAVLLQIYPLRGDWAFWRPPFVLLVCLYWLLNEPFRFGVGAAWTIGLLMDLLFGGITGQSALALTVCAYLVQTSGQRLHYFTILHQSALAGVLVAVYQLLVVSVEQLASTADPTWALFYSVFSGAVLWPLIAAGLGRLHHPRW